MIFLNIIIFSFIVPETDTVGSDDVGHSTYVQFVEGTTGDPTIFTNGQMYEKFI